MKIEKGFDSGLVAILIYLYFIQGLPYGVQSKFLPVYLRKRGYSLSQVGFMKLLYLPLILKPLYAPVIESYFTKMSWIRFTTTVLCGICLFMMIIKDLKPLVLVLGFLSINFFNAVQDVSLDSVTLTLAELREEIIMGNVAQGVGYKIGAMFGGGVLLTISTYIDWPFIFAVIAIFHIIGFFVTFYIVVEKKMSTKEHKGVSYSIPHSICNALHSKETIVTLFYLFFYKLGEQGATNMLPLFLIDNGVPVTKIGLYFGILGQIISIFGSAIGGFFISKLKSGYHGIIILNMLICSLLICLIPVVSGQHLSKPHMLEAAIVLYNIISFVSGLLSTATFTIMMQCSQTRDKEVQSTHYTILASTEILGKLLFAALIGYFMDKKGYVHGYILFAFLGLFSCLFLLITRKYFEFTTFYAFNFEAHSSYSIGKTNSVNLTY